MSALNVAGASELLGWATASALPVWAKYGVDRAEGGFFERLNADYRPTNEPRRVRLVSRQIYCYSVAHMLGVDGARDIVLHGLSFLRSRLIQSDGLLLRSIDLVSGELRRDADPYDYAFVLLALATATRAFPELKELAIVAKEVRGQLESMRHRVIGFREPGVLKANPHMHLLEAFLAWEQVSSDPCWPSLGDDMVRLCTSRLIPESGGVISEFYDESWRALPSNFVVEPGHLFEWAWLLIRWAEARSDKSVFDRAQGLVEFAESNGLRTRGKYSVAVNALDRNGVVVDADAKLWPQTERIKALHLIAQHPWSSDATRVVATESLPSAIQALRHYFDGAADGMWHEVLLSSGKLDDQPTRASSLYHIICALEQLAL